MARRVALEDQDRRLIVASEQSRRPAPGPRYRWFPLPPQPKEPAGPAIIDNIKITEIRLNAAKRDLRQFRHAYDDILELADVLAAINRWLADTTSDG